MKSEISDTPGQRLAKCLEDEFPESRIAKGLSEIASATVITRAGTVEPDFKVRLAALQTALSYKIGRPVERQEILTVAANADSAIGMQERLAHSPALRALFRKMLEAVETPPALDV